MRQGQICKFAIVASFAAMTLMLGSQIAAAGSKRTNKEAVKGR